MSNNKSIKQFPIYISSSICASLLTHPIDVIKVKLQTNLYNSPTQFITNQLKNKGVSFLFKGLRASVLRNGSFVTTKMFTYDYISSNYNTSSFSNKILCGMGAGLTGSLIGTPFDLIMVRIQNDPKQFPNIYTTIHKTYTKEGLFSFWNGLKYTMGRAIIVTACQFSIYEEMKQQLKNRHWQNEKNIFVISSVMSSVVTGLLSNPIDLCKTRTMNQCDNATITKIVRNEGFVSLWKGIYVNIGRQIPLNLIRFSILELLMTLLSE